MSNIVISRTSVFCEQDSHEYYKEVTSKGSGAGDFVEFGSMVDAYTTFAAIGYNEKHFVELKTRQEIFIAPSLNRDNHIPMMVALAYARMMDLKKDPSESLNLLMDTQTFMPFVHGWAQGGLEIVRRESQRNRVPPLEWVNNYVLVEGKKILASHDEPPQPQF